MSPVDVSAEVATVGAPLGSGAPRVATGTLARRLVKLATAHPERCFLDVAGDTWSWERAARRVEERSARWAASLANTDGPAGVVLPASNTADWVLDLITAGATGAVAFVPPEIQATPGESDRDPARLDAADLPPGARFRPTADGGLEEFRDVPGAPAWPLDTAFGLATSGSTGRPRFALRSAESLLAEGERYRLLLGIGPDDRIGAPLSLGHAFSLGVVLGTALASGAAVRLWPRFAPRTLGEALRREAITVLPLVPTAARLLVRAWGRNVPPAALRHVVVGAGPLDPELQASLERCLGRRPARNYGSTETGATLGTSGEAVPEGTTGAPLPGVEVHVAMPRPGEPGALFVRTPAPFLGHLSEDGLDASRVSPDGWVSTGDLARRSGENLVIVGRLGNTLRRGSRNVDPAAVTAALRLHPRVRDAVVLGTRDARGEEAVAAHVEIADGPPLVAAELFQHLADRLADHEVPTLWRLYSELPRTAGGKPDRQALEAPQALRPGSPPSAQPGDASVFLNALSAHRQATAVTVAHRIGLWHRLQATGAETTGELAAGIGLPADALTALLGTLQAAGLLAEGDGRWSLAHPLPADLDDLVELEDWLRDGPLSTVAVYRALGTDGIDAGEATAAALAAGGAERDALYRRTLGRAAPRLALLALRHLELVDGPVADVGRPAGAWAAAVSRRHPERTVGIYPVPLSPRPPLPRLGRGHAAVMVFNSLRFLATAHPELLRHLVAALAPGGWLVVADIFVDRHGPLPGWRGSLRLDWLAFGSTRWPTGEELTRDLLTMGLSGVERWQRDPTFDLVFARRPADWRIR